MIEHNKIELNKVPLKDKYRDELVYLLKQGHLDDIDLGLVEDNKEPGFLGDIKKMFK